ncbi:MAG: preprotein translocase subunit SecA [Brevinematales bacterium]|jgi:preprotein translocase subunit SecA
MNLLRKLINLIFGTKQQRDAKKMIPVVQEINGFENGLSTLSNDSLIGKTAVFKKRIENKENLSDILPEAYAVVREASKRTIGMRHFDVQLMGGISLNSNMISEMKTGEGKTLVATLPLYLNGLTGKGCHLITVNDYLAKRDALWMGPVYKFLGLTVGIINHDKSYKVEWSDISAYTVIAVECSRQDAYNCDITYGTNNEFGFDYLRDNMVFSLQHKVQKKHYFAIVDEVDSILIDEARTPLIISGPTDESTDLYYKIDKFIPRLTEAQKNEKNEPVEGSGDYAVDEKDKTAVLTDMGIDKIEKLLGMKDLYSPKNSMMVHHVIAGIRAHKLYQKDVAYVVENNEVVIVDEFTGRKMPGRRWSDGLHQAIEAKERVQIKQEFQTLATITFQNYFRMYEKLAGMTGTAETEAQEFYAIYKLDVAVIPTNMPVVRNDFADKIYLNENAKYRAIVRDVEEKHKKGQPILLGTISVEKSERISKLLEAKRIRHNVLNAKFHEKEAEIIANAGLKGSVTIATNMAGRGTDIKLGEGVVEAGGLHVIGSERHEARRIDNQLRGRTGRQGDPGSSQFYVSLQDDLMRIFGMDNQMGLMKSFGFGEDDEIQNRMISRAIEGAQKRVEGRNFEIRKNLLEYDNVMNEQRTYIYSIRDKILDVARDYSVIDELIHTIVEDYVINFEKPQRPESWNREETDKWFKHHFFTSINLDLSKMDYGTAIASLCSTIKSRVWDRLANVPEEIRAEGFKYVVLNSLDTQWKQHLRNIDSLQEGIGLRGYAQKNPVVEYKLEAYDLFRAMRAGFMLEAFSILSRLEIHTSADALGEEEAAIPVQTVHSEYDQFGSVKGGGAPATEKLQPIIKHEKLGRNDPCWCGSGKKYKVCHLEEDLRKERSAR